MDSDKLQQLVAVCLPGAPLDLPYVITREMSKESHGSLILKSANASIDLMLKERNVREQVIQFFLNEKMEFLNCDFLRTRLDLLLDILERIVKNGRQFQSFYMTVFKNHFLIGIDGRKVMESKREKEEFSTHWPRIFTRLAFLNNSRFIIVVFKDEPRDQSTQRCDAFLESFERVRTPMGWKSPANGQRTYVINKFIINEEAFAILDARNFSSGHDFVWGYVA
ncbi:unnamed protein product [Caenorhabditis sp. 36 PRJEB53466]|nr:unnamed protein product [Caenorhabditis sp. 36 PRJEB53466]